MVTRTAIKGFEFCRPLNESLPVCYKSVKDVVAIHVTNIERKMAATMSFGVYKKFIVFFWGDAISYEQNLHEMKYVRLRYV